MMAIQVPAPPQAPLPPGVIEVHGGGFPLDSSAIVMIVLASLAVLTLVLWPLARALARRLEGRGAPDPAMQHELDELRSRVHELEAGQVRMTELEDRLDFAERILAQRQEPVRLPEGR